MMSFMNLLDTLDIASLISGYHTHRFSPSEVIEIIFQRIATRGTDGIWTYVQPKQTVLARVSELEQLPVNVRTRLPLWGIPFSVKDCIDVAGLPTTCACPGFTYIADYTNPVVTTLINAGAILIGKTNLDQFATGLVGIRTGFDIPRNPFGSDYIPGGSSSGAAVSVSTGLVSFAVGTDTGGSGRVPASFNNIVGLKPTRGLLSTAHIVDACRTLDCVSIFALNVEDAWKIAQIAKGFDPQNSFSRHEANPPANLESYHSGQAFRFGVPLSEHQEFFGNKDIEGLFLEAIQTLIDMGGTCIPINYTPFMEANDLLFRGPWIAERYASVGAFIEANQQAVLPITRDIILSAKQLTAADVFKGLYHLADLKKTISPVWQQIDVLVVPTTGTIYRIAEVENNPLELNANLGYYTNFVNLLDLSALAIPNGFQHNGIPAGITLIAPPFSEQHLVDLGAVFHRHRTVKSDAVSSIQ
ncbi:MAG: Allophanate hydrolase [Chroococcidiopsis cubana SAG 39.79]|uniref:Amidase domain-containing protein n=2 Tax=Chroococcidiopsis TaxID=54298 RepID=A0AB37UDV8_9CYAN|nr:allophanate hydrolase [Chroococcidiopsis cubana]MDZ4872204.1 Allophanate hydrolase [Chroococcidiopsis cubana SAG 39.79]PSB63941.1 allophanate hydrolase [Chroococcidiopsis cubana CCALA 043]RUT07974.1 hypothetical protein DSM107010_49240 [Chroococcidiopsis cubana SAG 39.79]